MNNIIYAGKHLLTHSVNRHAHSSWELVYCTGGSGTFLFDNLEIPYSAGDLVVIPPLVPHSNRSAEGFTNLHINMTDTAFSFREPFVIQDDRNQFIFQAFNAAYVHFSGAHDRRRLLLPPCGDMICGYVMAYRNTKPLSKVVEEIESAIIQNYPNCDYALDKYLQSLPFSCDYLRKLFKQEMGVTPHRYLTDKRLQTAADMLTYGYGDSSNIAEISRLCGFREPLYFSRMFRKKFGVAPSYYPEIRQNPAEGTSSDSDSMKILLDPEDT